MINPYAGLSGISQAIEQTTGDGSDTLGKEDFLSLLVTQMQNQDPLDPLKNEEFVAQLAQFSSLEQLINLNSSMDEANLLQSSINNSQAVNLIGKNITVKGNAMELQDGNPNNVSYFLGDDANQVMISVYDEDGALVRSITVDGQEVGKHDFDFDGQDSEGNTLPDGSYTFNVSAKDADGNPIDVVSYSDVKVDGVNFDNGIVYLKAGGSRFMLSDVLEVNE